ncbi:AMP-dependent synthetase [Nocardioides marmoriginsengisoli]|uniref:AMP-dependent synthetase n=1 Tax=Nocardioides marmoriginsengisoli TaxID=661483 RepID=A0A3N0CIG8_9ACTN|nr:AMP-binding protein [Nocardioides marmoriginsengisoli]RNL62743.1 AMP-dependent synthetase [Nocardioides marmoriginsengisoli]
MHLSSLPDLRAEFDPDGPAVSDDRESLTNLAFLARVRAAARHLDDLGIGPGQVVALKLSNRLEFVVLLFAAWRLGATVTPVNPSLTSVEVTRQLEDSGARLLVIEDDAPDEAWPGGALLAVSDLYAVAEGKEWTPRHDSDELALLIYTSGTTGAPKGVMLDHANLDAMTQMGLAALQLGRTDRCLLILPLFHVNGIVVSVLTPLLAHASVAIAGRFNPHSFFETVERERPTYFSAVPTIYGMLAQLPENSDVDWSSLRFGVCGAAPAAPDLLVAFEARYGFPVVEAYGLSEATCGSTFNPLDGPRRPGTVGIALPGQQVRIVDSHDHELPVGGVGEVVVRGRNVMRGYLGQPEETARVVVDGWLHTGDLGQLDADGYLTLVGRSKDMIIRGGENIYPKEIEDVLSADPSVAEVAVVGVPDKKWGERVVAFVQPPNGRAIDTPALRARCVESLSGFKRPTETVVLETLPKNAVGKIDKIALRAAYSSPH